MDAERAARARPLRALPPRARRRAGRPLRLAGGAGAVPAQCARCDVSRAHWNTGSPSATKVRRACPPLSIAPQLRPLSVGEVLDASFKIVRQSFGTLAGCVLVVALPLNIIDTLIPASTTRQRVQPRHRASARRTSSTGHASSPAACCVGLHALGPADASAAAACFRAVSSVYLGEQPTVGGSLSFARRPRAAGDPALVPLLPRAGIPPSSLLIIPGIWLRGRVVGELPGAAVGGHRPGRGARALLPARQGPLVADVRRARRDVPDRGRDQRHPRRAARRDADRLARQRGAGGGHLHDRQHPLVADHAAAVRGGADVIYFDLRVRKEGFDLQLLARGVGQDRARTRRARRPSASRAGSAAAASAGGSRHAQGGGSRRPQAPAPRRGCSGARRPDEPPSRRRRRGGCRAAIRWRPPPERREGDGGGTATPGRAAGAGRARRQACRPDAPAARRAGARGRSCTSGASAAADVPRPFAGLLRWLGDRLQPVARLHRRLALRSLPGGRPVRLLDPQRARPARRGRARARLDPAPDGGRGRRAARGPRGPRARTPPRSSARPTAPPRPATGSAPCACASAPGLLRLDAARGDRVPAVADHGRGRRGGRARPAFARVGADFDAIAYGGRPAQAEDDEAASREGWQRVLEASAR